MLGQEMRLFRHSQMQRRSLLVGRQPPPRRSHQCESPLAVAGERRPQAPVKPEPLESSRMPTATPDWRLPSALHPLRNTWGAHRVHFLAERSLHLPSLLSSRRLTQSLAFPALSIALLPVTAAFVASRAA